MDSQLQERVLNALRLSVPKPLAGMIIEPQHSLAEDLGIDSLGLITLAMLLDQELGVKMSNHLTALVEAKTVQQLCALADSLVAQRTAEMA